MSKSREQLTQEIELLLTKKDIALTEITATRASLEKLRLRIAETDTEVPNSNRIMDLLNSAEQNLQSFQINPFTNYTEATVAASISAFERSEAFLTEAKNLFIQSMQETNDLVAAKLASREQEAISTIEDPPAPPLTPAPAAQTKPQPPTSNPATDTDLNEFNALRRAQQKPAPQKAAASQGAAPQRPISQRPLPQSPAPKPAAQAEQAQGQQAQGQQAQGQQAQGQQAQGQQAQGQQAQGQQAQGQQAQGQQAQGQQAQGQQAQGQQAQGQQAQGQQAQGQQAQGQQAQGQQAQGQQAQGQQAPPPIPMAQLLNELQAAITAAQAADDAYTQAIQNRLLGAPLPPPDPNSVPTQLDLIRRSPASNLQEILNNKTAELTQVQLELDSLVRENRNNLNDPAVQVAQETYSKDLHEITATLTSLREDWQNAKRLAQEAKDTHRRVMQLSQEKMTRIQDDLIRAENQNPQNAADVQRLEKELTEAEAEHRILAGRANAATQRVQATIETDKELERSAQPIFQIYSNPKDKREFENMRKNLSELFLDGKPLSSRFLNFVDTYDNVAANAPHHAEDRKSIQDMDRKLRDSNTDLKGLRVNTIRFIKTATAQISIINNNPKLKADAKAREIAALQQEISHAETCMLRFDNIDKNLDKLNQPQMGYSYFGSGEDATFKKNDGTDLEIEDVGRLLKTHLETDIAPTLRNLGGQFGLVSMNQEAGAPSPKYTGDFINRFYPANIDSDPRIRGCVIQSVTPRSFKTIIAYQPQDLLDAQAAGKMTPLERDIPHGLWLNEAKKHIHSHLCKENYLGGPIYLNNIHKAPPELLQALVIVAAKEGKILMADRMTESKENQKLLENLKSKVTEQKVFKAQETMFSDTPENREDPLRRMAKKSVTGAIPMIAPVQDPVPPPRRGRP